jgi:probable F420-dependent oxidoreductase
MTLRIGLTAYDIAARDFVDLAVAADEAGFESLWLGEHIVLPIGYDTTHPTTGQTGEQHHAGPIVTQGTELVDPLVTLGAAAVATAHIRLATGVYVLPLRHPLAIARSTCTVQELAGGRFTFGIGFGWLAEEFAALDVPFDERVTRFTESIDVLRAAWAGGDVRYQGRHFTISGVQVTLRDTRIPIVLGGNTDRALRRAARLADGWFSSGTPSLEESLRLRDELQRLRTEADAEIGGERPFELTFRMSGCDPGVARRYEDEGFERVLVWTDHVWPADQPLAVKRDQMFERAAALGVTPHHDDAR